MWSPLHFGRRLVRLRPELLAAAGLTLATPARATIVWEGKEVPAWPDVPIVAPSNGAELAVSTQLFPHPSGVVHGLTILVDFSDQTAAYSKADVDAWLNQAGFTGFGLRGSVRDYYLGQSQGKVDYQNEVHGFYRAKKPKSYYDDGGYERADELWDEVVEALDAEIDYSKFDNDGDGKTEAISLLYAGGEGTFGKGLWPHAAGSDQQRDGVRLNRYMMTAMNNKPTNYVFSHESGHMLFGWPDLYGVGDYCIMANRGSDTNPVGINDMFRADQGWIDVVDIDSSTNARLSSTPDGVVYRFLNPERPTEYFLWSNLENQQEWVSIHGSGLLVWHFDQAIRGNNPPEPLQLAVVQAGGNRQLSATTWPSPGSAATDLFTEGGKNELGTQTQPSTSWNDGSPSGLHIYDISAPGAAMQFSVGTGPLPPGGAGGGGAGSVGGASAGKGGNDIGGNALGGSAQAGTASVAGSGGAGFGGTAGGAPLPTSESGANAGNGVVSSSPTAAAAADAGCSCRLPEGRQSVRSALAFFLAMGGLLANRRRRRSGKADGEPLHPQCPKMSAS
ncbi:MAG TPA: M6 family metalloprotease domain-containing protein [Polyangiaceae bacterium]|nr:M6 family metalloprotease domain-containing protein [Polyangiaceae bacterium]